ncbi:FAD-binding oxidoreductase [Nocardiopsis salina]|uniref:FAD-binding oxidoreductase n=1 Tax=Nocardiopsis salina TaxID=245836 RepID=UPI00047618E3|nr:FAD-binding protein [Nocardiopsis salina]
MTETTHTQAPLRPLTTAELVEALHETERTHPRLSVSGAGTAPGWGAPPAPHDRKLDVSALSGILRHNPADMTIAVLAGTPMRAVQTALAEHGQQIALDAARISEGATVGGLMATADSGPAQLVHGTLRDLVIGVGVTLADGTFARSGGHVIKNVAGYDLAKLFQGSLGSLGIITEVVLRAHPQPRAVTTAQLPLTFEEAVRTGERVLASSLEPSALTWHDNHLSVRFEGNPEGVADRTRALAETIRAPVSLHHSGAQVWEEVDELAVAEPGDTVLRIGGRPTAGPALIAALDRSVDRRQVDADVASDVGAGVHTIRLRSGNPEQRADLLTDLRAAATELGATTVVRRRDGLPQDTDLWGTPPAYVSVMRTIKRQLDPDDRFGSGRLAPWL